ncbi:MAG: hypothetical protein E5W82_10320 [Mesorhizobium sp.]|nr:MAG: hypothetical protein E5W82_10320 [Mesorhizobium sp.]
MGVALMSGIWPDAEIGELKTEQYQSCQACIYPEGDVCEFTIKHENRDSFVVSVPFSLIGTLYHEVRYAAQLMIYRQRMKLDRGIQKMLELCSTALRPTTTEVLLDKSTGDRLIVYQFTEHAPFCVRMTPDETASFVAKLNLVDKLAAH